jgi:hypothetical protein
VELQPHIGEYTTKTNAIRTPKQGEAAPGEQGRPDFESSALRVLLAVVDQNLVAGLGQLGAVLLQAVQDNEVGLSHHRTAELLHVVSAGLLLLRRPAVLLLLGNGCAGDRKRQQSGYQESLTHCVPLFLQQGFQPDGISGQTIQIAKAADCTRAGAPANTAKFTAIISLNRSRRRQIRMIM